MPCNTVTVEPSTEQMVGFESYSFEGGQNQVTVHYTVYNDSSENATIHVKRSAGDKSDVKREPTFSGSTSSSSYTFDVPVNDVAEVQACVEIVKVE